jgi:hypothetical protein
MSFGLKAVGMVTPSSSTISSGTGQLKKVLSSLPNEDPFPILTLSLPTMTR